jgi:predicted Fe-Mo cluster-binding NifX family protein
MKILLTATSPSLEANIDPRFGRGAYLIAVDTDTLEWQAQPNPGVNASGGAGTQAAQIAADQQVKAVISGDFGPNAYNALQAAGIKMYLYGESTTLREAIEHFKAGKLKSVEAPTGGGRHARGW